MEGQAPRGGRGWLVWITWELMLSFFFTILFTLACSCFRVNFFYDVIDCQVVVE